VVHGAGKSATIEFLASSDAADSSLLAKFSKIPLAERMDLFRKNQKRSPEFVATMARALAEEAAKLEDADPARAFEIALLVEKVPESTSRSRSRRASCPSLSRSCRSSRTGRCGRRRSSSSPRSGRKTPVDPRRVFFKEEDGRTIEWMDRKLGELSPETREKVHGRSSPPRAPAAAFVWFAQKAAQDEAFRARLTPQVLGRLLDACRGTSWAPSGRRSARCRPDRSRRGLAR